MTSVNSYNEFSASKQWERVPVRPLEDEILQALPLSVNIYRRQQQEEEKKSRPGVSVNRPRRVYVPADVTLEDGRQEVESSMRPHYSVEMPRHVRGATPYYRLSFKEEQISGDGAGGVNDEAQLEDIETEEEKEQATPARPHYSVHMPRQLEQATAYYRTSIRGDPSMDDGEGVGRAPGVVQDDHLRRIHLLQHKFEHLAVESRPLHDDEKWAELLAMYRYRKGLDD